MQVAKVGLKKNLHLLALAVTLASSSTSALAQTKRIVTYIEDVQEERKSTRWTLTEWLRIKERMKLMDLWLAMFSTPQQKFAPELALSYAKGVGESEFTLGSLNANSALETRGTHEAEEMRAQFWFTNLISGTTGLRTLDIDIGIEASLRNRFIKGTDALLNPDASGTAWNPDTSKLQQGGINLRIFGANSQDSSLVVKGGKFERRSGFNELETLHGTYWGSELSLYLLSFLGAEGQYTQYLDGKDKRGSAIQAMGFVEIYNVRVGYGQSRYEWKEENLNAGLDSKELERYLSFRLYF